MSLQHYQRVKRRSCQRDVVFVTTVDGRKVALDPQAPVFHRNGGESLARHDCRRAPS